MSNSHWLTWWILFVTAQANRSWKYLSEWCIRRSNKTSYARFHDHSDHWAPRSQLTLQIGSFINRSPQRMNALVQILPASESQVSIMSMMILVWYVTSMLINTAITMTETVAIMIHFLWRPINKRNFIGDRGMLCFFFIVSILPHLTTEDNRQQTLVSEPVQKELLPDKSPHLLRPQLPVHTAGRG